MHFQCMIWVPAETNAIGLIEAERHFLPQAHLNLVAADFLN